MNGIGECIRAIWLPEELPLLELQLQHKGIKFHVQVVGSLQLPFIVFPDVQGMSEMGRRVPEVSWLHLVPNLSQSLGMVHSPCCC